MRPNVKIEDGVLNHDLLTWTHICNDPGIYEFRLETSNLESYIIVFYVNGEESYKISYLFTENGQIFIPSSLINFKNYSFKRVNKKITIEFDGA